MLTIVREESESMIRSHDASDLSAALADKTRPFWVDLESPTAAEFELLHGVFNFHPLAVEDAMRPRQRPKIDEYEGYFFLVADEVNLHLNDTAAADADDVESRQVSMFLGTNYL